MDTVVELVKALAWPVTVGLLCWCFRVEIRQAIARMLSAKLPGGTELKFGTAAKTPHLRVMQKIWLERNTKHGGNPLVLVGAVIDDHLEFGIAHGNKAGKMTAAKTNKDWMACCTTVWLDRVVWSEFLSILRNPESQA